MTQADKLLRLQDAELTRLETTPEKLWLVALVLAVSLHMAVAIGILLHGDEPQGTIGAPESIMLEFAEEPTAPDVDNVSETIQEATVTDKPAEPIEEEKPEEEKPEEVVDKPEEIKTPESDMVEEIKKPVEEEKPQKTIEQPKPKKQTTTKRPVKIAKRTQKSSGPQIAAKSGNTYAGPVNSRNDGSFGREAATWKTKVQRRIKYFALRSRNRYTGRNRTAYITFQFDDSGNITSAVVSNSSGDANADALALQTVKRATPIPPPPEGWKGSLTIPVEMRP